MINTLLTYMRKHLFLLSFVLLFSACCGSYEEERTRRVTETNVVTQQINDNINSIVVIFQAVAEEWVITKVEPIVQDGRVVGYTFYFDKHDPINVYLEFYKADQNSLTYQTPVIGVKLDKDNRWYWTLNGEWLLDSNSDKVPVTQEDGATTTPKTPQIKIIDNYWCLTLDGGKTWTQLYLVTDKTDNPSCTCDKLRDDIFRTIGFDDDKFFIVLSDGQTITIPHTVSPSDLPQPGTNTTEDTTPGGNGGSDNETDNNGGESGPVVIEGGAIKAAFSVSPTKKVYFSQGNLQEYVTNIPIYNPEIGERRFALNQYDICVGTDSCPFGYSKYIKYMSCFSQEDCEEVSGWVDMFISGGGNLSASFQFYNVWDNKEQFGYSGDVDYGNSKISNGSGIWRTLSYEEWEYLLNERPNAENLKSHGTIKSRTGCILLPDNWKLPEGQKFTAQASSNTNTYSIDDWKKMESRGAVFLPATGYLDEGWRIEPVNPNFYAFYWSSTFFREDEDIKCWKFNFATSGDFKVSQSYSISLYCAVRLVKEAN